MLARKSVFSLSSDIVNALLSYLALYLVARFMSPGVYGAIAFATGYVALLTIYGDLGFDSAHIKYVSAGEDKDQCISVHFYITLILSFVGIATTVGSVIIWKFILHHGFESPELETVLYIILLSLTIKGLVAPFQYAFMARQEMAKAKLIAIFGTIGRLLGTIYVVVFHLDLIVFAWIYVAEGIITLSAALLLYHHRIIRPKWEMFKMYLGFATPMAIAGILGTAISNFSPVLIQLCFSSADVGFYSAAIRIITMLGMFTNALGILLFPVLSSMHSKGDTKGMLELIHDSERYLSMVAFPLVFGTMSMAVPIVYVLLAGWTNATPILQIIPLFILFSALQLPFYSHVIGSDHPRMILSMQIISFCFCIGLNLLLVPKVLLGVHLPGLSGVGAAIALVASSFVGWVYCRTMSHKLLPELTVNRHGLAHLFAAVMMGIVVYWFLSVNPVLHWWMLIVVGGAYVAGYLGILVVIGEFKRKDFDIIWNAVDPKKMFRYAKDEVGGK